MEWSTPIVVLLAVAGVVGAVLTLLAAFGKLQAAYGRTARGRRRATEQRLERLAAGARLSIFVTELGESAQTQTIGEYTEHVWPLWGCYVQAITDTTDTVVMYSVTSRAATFRPRLRTAPGIGFPSLDVRLGDLRFSDIPFEPERIYAEIGARRFWYWETYYFGNPGGYRWFAFALNDAGTFWGDDVPSVGSIAPFEYYGGGDEEFHPPATVTSFRASARPNAFAVTAPAISTDDLPFRFGPDLDRVRVLPR